MASYPYVQSPAKTRKLFEELNARGKPPRVTQRWLAAAGLGSRNDRTFIPLLKFLNILDDNGGTTEHYDRLRQTDWESQLAEIIQVAYAELFQALPDIQRRSRGDIEAQFKGLDASVSARVAGMMASTFLGLLEVANFTNSSSAGRDSQVDEGADYLSLHGGEQASELNRPTSKSPVSVNINISLEIPVTDKSDVYENLFRSMAEHLGELISAHHR